MKLIDDYIEGLKANKLSIYTIKNYYIVLKKLNSYKSVDTITEQELKQFFNSIEVSHNTFILYQVVIKKFFTDIGKGNIVQWIILKRAKETLKPDDVLTSDDVNKLIDVTDSHYYKAMIAFLFESGCRFSEAHSLKYHDLKETDAGMIVHIPTTKTAAGYRKVILPFSAQYIRNLKTYLNAKSDDVVFNVGNHQSNAILHTLAKKAGIDKPCHCHSFRHSQATTAVQLGYNEAIIRKKLGWSATSTMIARYQHLSDEDVINATLSNTGKIPKTAVRTEIKEAQKLSLVDAAMQFSRLSEENEMLKKDMQDMKELLHQIQRVTGLDVEKSNAKDQLKKVWVT